MGQQFTNPKLDVRRDRWGRPYIKQEDGSEKAYTRCTTFVGALDDQSGLSKWKTRMAILGIVDRDDLRIAAAAARDDKRELGDISERAIEAARGSEAATMGTAVHTFTEKVDSGLPTGRVPNEIVDDLRAYREATAGLDMVAIEQFVVNDQFKVGGTFDRLIELNGVTYVGDLKTGNLEHSSGKIAMQMAMYAHSVLYDPATGKRAPLPPVDQDRGIVIHLPAGEGVCTLYWFDLKKGWEGVQLCAQVREWRGVRKMHEEFQVAGQALAKAGLVDEDLIMAEIKAAADRNSLEAIWRENKEAFTAAHVAAAKQRLASLK